jgi:hypothetical protein
MPAESQLHLACWSPGASEAPTLVRTIVRKIAPARPVWLLLEQMHRFDFAGDLLADVMPLLTDEALEVFGLRGRVFWHEGQVHWRRVEGDTVHVAAASDVSFPLAEDWPKPASAESMKVERLQPRPLILWGKAIGAAYRELRVGGQADLPYPPALVPALRDAAFPTLTAQVYVDAADGREVYWRLAGAEARGEAELQVDKCGS